jgi:hypothetical protein
MLKRVPDPPFNLHSLDDTRLLKSDLSLWDGIFPQAVLMQPRLCVSVLRRASTHDLDTLRTSIESAQVHVRKPANLQTLY